MITVTADADNLMRLGMDAPGGMELVDDTDNALGYIADVMAAVSHMIVHAECKYGPFVTDMIIEALQGVTIKNKIEEARKEGAECESGE